MNQSEIEEMDPISDLNAKMLKDAFAYIIEGLILPVLSVFGIAGGIHLIQYVLLYFHIYVPMAYGPFVL
jgi:hypothetical protein